MKSIRIKTLLVLLVGALVAHAHPNGPNSIRYSVDTQMTATGVDADASGRVQAFLRQAGSSDRHRLRVSAAGLDPRTSYTVLAQLDDDPNFVTVTNFTTSARGSGRVVYVSAQGANGKRALPAMLAPVVTVRAIAVANTNGEIVLTVDLHQAGTMRFELTSIFENTGNDALAIGCVAVACQDGEVQFRMFAGASDSQLTFYVNGGAVETYNADPTGRISVGVLPPSAPSPLDFRNLSLRNSAGAVVLQSDVR